jgi:hypothetical protein
MHRDDMMVLYFDMIKGDRSEAIQKVFDKTKTPFRGPAQDKKVLKLKPDGDQEVLKLDSNDNCWNSPSWREKEYKPDVFLRRYLEIAFRGYKDPTRPFMSGLLPVSIGESGLHPDSLKTQGPMNDLANRLDLPLFIYSEVPKSPFKSS